ncbi:MAG: hypothetical protein PHH49_02250 [Candidatus Omnitrophica bacterium]|nr:hypothetical protein [Candidatus Omnitrophota bacterium]
MAAIMFVILVSLTVAAFSGSVDRYFSYQRFFLNQRFVDDISNDGQLNRSIKSFAANFTDGLYAFSAGDYTEALVFFMAARSFWPEFFATDFLIALIYEANSSYDTAARYYKSYLEKLRDFHNGRYGLSGEIIYAITTFDIEDDREAYDNIRERMLDKGIDIDAVSPERVFPREFMPYILIALAGGCYVLIAKVVMPLYRRWYRVKFPPEGFWTCRRCGTYNPGLSNECKECRHAR